ncbi:mannitol dehydrogenase family protein [Microbacterium hydrocarbonoxydans]|uniref:mannitol dehydrogenase family protein n=1 Tax=Microbacterium hydrocarbonoxydans TaxID=273678 RepID=UPI001FB9775E|nr:mannitol dehydrogenase family protein [Microbacterium hydrocarbonoxydans]
MHLGLGAFHRAHQAWYTAHADPAGEWGIAAFTGRGPAAAHVLGAQEGLYTLIERGPDGDRYETVTSIVETHDASETAALRALVSRPEVTVVTLTVTEKGYHLDASGALDTGDADVVADSVTLRRSEAGAAAVEDGALRTMPGRLLWALLGRAESGAGPIAVVSCDNLAGNGAAARAAVMGLAELVNPALASAIEVDWIHTSIDRITPRTTVADIEAVATRTGILDLAPVVTERYSSWILSGRFRAARPRWEDAGALFVDVLEPFERRKLWMLNGAHSLLAYAGIGFGHTTVAEAIADERCAKAVGRLWDLHARLLSESGRDLDLDDYRLALAARFANSAIAHRLDQIAADGSVKLRSRIVEVVQRERSAGGSADAALRVMAEWIRFVLAACEAGRIIEDAAAAEIVAAAAASDPTRGLLALIAPELADDEAILMRVIGMLATPLDVVGHR